VQNCSRPAPARTGSLAESAEWMASSFEKTMPAMVHDLNEGTALAEEEDQMLGCLGAAVMMRWDTLPTKIQRELFECATSIGDLRQTAPIEGQRARFLQPTRALTGSYRKDH